MIYDASHRLYDRVDILTYDIVIVTGVLYPTEPLYNIIIIYDKILLGRNEILNTKNNEFNSAAIFPVWHELSMLRCGQINVAGIVDGRKLENSSV